MANIPGDDLDGCDVDMTQRDQLSSGPDEVAALVMFADCWDKPAEVELRKQELIAWNEAVDGSTG